MPLIGRFAWTGGSGGVNLYLGNERGADGIVPRQDVPVTYGARYRDSVQVFAEQVYRVAIFGDGPQPARVAPSDVSRYWTGRALEEIVADPARWLGLMTRKAAFLLGNRELPNNRSFAFALADDAPWLGALLVRWWLLLALAGAGVYALHHAARRDRGAWRAAAGPLVLIALHAAGVLLFFVNARYRLPLWPALAALAGVGLIPHVRRDA
ncbi:MAG: hypothetical protein AAF772_02455, partial [Acidobacteriota bacterium]